MADQVHVDTEALISLARSYSTLEEDSGRISVYLDANCRLGDAVGFLLLWLKEPFEKGTANGIAAFRSAGDTLRAASDQVLNALNDAESAEQDRIRALEDLNAQLEAKLAAQPSGGGSGGGGGGSLRPVSPGAGAALPTAPTTPISGTTPPTGPVGSGLTINIDDRDTTVTVGDDNTGTISVNGASSAPSGTGLPGTATATPTGGGPSLIDRILGRTGSSTTSIDPHLTGTPADGVAALGGAAPADPATAAHDNALYAELWDEIAKDDPLHRSADQLRELWESREAIQLPADGAGQSTLGYGAPTDAAAMPDLRILIDIPAGGGTPTVQAEGAER